MVVGLSLVLLLSILFLKRDMGKSKTKVPFTQLFSKTPAINVLSAARFCLFGARDVWFVVGLPIYLGAVLGWDFTRIGTFFAAWIIGYGIVQSSAPNLLRRNGSAPVDGATS